MLKLLKKMFSVALVLLLLAAVIGGLFLLAWWADWPFMTVAVPPLALLALVLLVYAARRIWRWRSRTAYVRSVLMEDPSRVAQAAAPAGPFQRIWTRGMQHLGGRTWLPGHATPDEAYRHPWVLALGDSGSRLHALAAMQAPPQADSPNEPDPPLHWHFLQDMVLIEPGAALIDSDQPGPDWESLLAELGRARAREPVNAFLAAVDAGDLAAARGSQEGTQKVRRLALRMRARIDDILAVVPARAPLRVVVTGIGGLAGMAGFCARLSRQAGEEWLGHEFPPAETDGSRRNPGGEAARIALDGAVARLRRIMVEEAARGAPPDGDDLLAPTGLLALGDGLAHFMETILRPSPDSGVPFLRGIHFVGLEMADGDAAAGTGIFAAGLFRGLAADRGLARAVRRATPRDIPLAAAHAGACLLLLAMCAAFGSTAIYNHRALTSLSSGGPADESTAAGLGVLVADARAVRWLDAATRHWWVPSFGLDRLTKVLEKSKQAFVAHMREKTVPQFLAECRAAAAGHKDDFPYATLQRLLWIRDVTEKGGAGESRPFPVEDAPPGAAAFWTPAFGRLYLDFLAWSRPVDRQNVQTLLASAIADIVGHDEEKTFRHVIALVNANSPQWDVPISRFWPNVPRGSTGFVAVPPAYTARGFARVVENMDMLTRGTGRNFRESAYWKPYLREYARAWEDFIPRISAVWNAQDNHAMLQEMSSRPGSDDDPYMRLLQAVVEEIQPLRQEKGMPGWMEDACLLRALVQINALAAGPSGPLAKKKTPGMASIFWNAATSLDQQDLNVVRSRIADIHDLDALEDAVKAIAGYQGALDELYQTSRDMEGSLELARIDYGGREFGDPQATAAARARKCLDDVAAVLGFTAQKGTSRVRRDRGRSGQAWDGSPVSSILGGQLRFLQHLVVCNAAAELQRQWESEVMAQGALLPADSPPDALFGDGGLVSQFMAKRTTPFLTRSTDEYRPRTANGAPFPFTDDFLAFLGKGRQARSHPRKEGYVIPIRSGTPGVNADARERIQHYEMRLTCKSGILSLRNSNYPTQARFEYRPKECGAVDIEIVLPSLSLHYAYEDFPEFLRDFSYGERRFTQEDFPDAAERMAGVGLTEITLRMLAQNAGEVLEAFGDELPLPERITGVW